MGFGERTSCQYTNRKFNLVENLSDFDDHLIEHIKFPTDEACPFLLTTKEELDAFRESKTQKEHVSASIF